MMCTNGLRRVLLALSLFMVAVLAAVDLGADAHAGAGVAHLVIEAVLTAAALTAAFIEVRTLLTEVADVRAESALLTAGLATARSDAARFASEASALVSGLSAAIDQQLERWALSLAEKETALLLLKGLSHKEIGETRHVSEATARQQARAVYKKAGLSGRNDLAAFFLEDLLAPLAPATRSEQQGSSHGVKVHAGERVDVV